MFARCHKGTILLELMIAIALSMLVVTSLMQLYLTIWQGVRSQLALQRIQHQAIKAIGILRASVHQAGYIGCGKLSLEFPITGELSVRNKLLSPQINTLQVRHAAQEHAVLTEEMQTNLSMRVTHDRYFKAGEVVVISNCRQAEIFEIGAVIKARRHQTLLAAQPLKHRYDKNSEVARYVVDTFYVSPQKSALYRRDIKGIKNPLVSGIEEMQLEFTIQDENHVVDLSADQINDWTKVVGVAVRLVVASAPFKKEWYAYIRV